MFAETMGTTNTFFSATADTGGLWFPEQATGEQRLLYDSVRQFTETAMAPHEAALEQHDYAVARALFKACAALGVFVAELDEADGGLGFGVVDATLLCEALGRGHSLNVGLMVHQGVGMLPVACFGTEAQQAEYLPGAGAGECIMAFALTEPHCGSDALALATTAIPDGGGYVLNGAKQFITNAAYADCFVTFARVPDAGITAFLVDAGTPGLSVGPEEKKLGQQASSTCSVYYDNVRVDGTTLLGNVGEGHRIALNMLNLGRLKLAAACVGKMKVLLPQAVAYTKNRAAFGQPISEFGMVRDRIARMAALCYTAESTVYRVASVMENALSEARGDRASLPPVERLAVLQEFALECAMVKAFVTESLGTFTDDMLQLYGGYGFSEEYPAAKAFRDARVTRLYEGTTEICRLTAMRRLCSLAMLGEFEESVLKTRGLFPSTMAKFMLGRQLKTHVENNLDDIEQIQRKQNLTNEFVSAFEKIYALESGCIRCLVHAGERKRDQILAWGRYLDVSNKIEFHQYLVWHAQAIMSADVFAPIHGMLYEYPDRELAQSEDYWRSPPFGHAAPSRNLVAQRILDSGGILPGSL